MKVEVPLTQLGSPPAFGVGVITLDGGLADGAPDSGFYAFTP